MKKEREVEVDAVTIQAAVSIERMVRKRAESNWDHEAEILIGLVVTTVSRDEKDQLHKGGHVLNLMLIRIFIRYNRHHTTL